MVRSLLNCLNQFVLLAIISFVFLPLCWFPTLSLFLHYLAFPVFFFTPFIIHFHTTITVAVTNFFKNLDDFDRLPNELEDIFLFL